MIEETGKKAHKICLITLATDLPEAVAKDYEEAFKDLKISEITALHYVKRQEADSPENLKKVKDCDLILFTGGQQLKLNTLLGGTELWN